MSKIVDITPAERQMILDALQDRACKLFRLAEHYKEEGDWESEKECNSESRKVLALFDKIHAI